jgi:hypothetical protein
MLSCLRVAADLKNVESLPDTVSGVQRIIHGKEGGAEASGLMHSGDLDIPGRKTLHEARIRLDWAQVLLARMHNRVQADAIRYLTCDASPQKGEEMFVVREMVCRGKHRSPWVRLPLMTLGAGCASALDKSAAMAHAVFLQSGPSMEEMRRYCSSVRAIVTDSGPELLIADAPDLLQPYLDSEAGRRDVAEFPEARGTFMFPRALRIPGVSHLVDGVVKTLALHGSMPFFCRVPSACKGGDVFSATHLVSSKAAEGRWREGHPRGGPPDFAQQCTIVRQVALGSLVHGV